MLLSSSSGWSLVLHSAPNIAKIDREAFQKRTMIPQIEKIAIKILSRLYNACLPKWKLLKRNLFYCQEYPRFMDCSKVWL